MSKQDTENSALAQGKDGTVRENVNKKLNPEEYQQTANSQDSADSHFGAEEEKLKKSKPPTQELADLTDHRGQAADPQDSDYNPGDEITPG